MQKAIFGRMQIEWIDTGGLEDDDLTNSHALLKAMRRQAQMALHQAEAVLFVIDAEIGITPLDHLLAKALKEGHLTAMRERLLPNGEIRVENVPIILVANKIDLAERSGSIIDMWEAASTLGLGAPVCISATDMSGFDELSDRLILEVGHLQGDRIFPGEAPTDEEILEADEDFKRYVQMEATYSKPLSELEAQLKEEIMEAESQAVELLNKGSSRAASITLLKNHLDDDFDSRDTMNLSDEELDRMVWASMRVTGPPAHPRLRDWLRGLAIKHGLGDGTSAKELIEMMRGPGVSLGESIERNKVNLLAGEKFEDSDGSDVNKNEFNRYEEGRWKSFKSFSDAAEMLKQENTGKEIRLQWASQTQNALHNFSNHSNLDVNAAQTLSWMAAAEGRRLDEPLRPELQSPDNLEASLISNGGESSFPSFESRLPMTAESAHAYLTTRVSKLKSKRARDLVLPIRRKSVFDKRIELAIVGSPNVGKSTLVNSLLQEERVLTANFPGSTTDVISLDYNFKNHPIRIHDTAGITRHWRSKCSSDSELFEAMLKSWRTIKNSHTAILVVSAIRNDGTPVSGLDLASLHIADKVVSEHAHPLVLAVNKWDLVPDINKQEVRNAILSDVDGRLGQVKGLPVVFISAGQSHNIGALMNKVLLSYRRWNSRIPTSELNSWLRAFISRFPPPWKDGQRCNVKYMTQVSARPPTFVFWSNVYGKFPPNYVRQLTNNLREEFGLEGVPVRTLLRSTLMPKPSVKLSKVELLKWRRMGPRQAVAASKLHKRGKKQGVGRDTASDGRVKGTKLFRQKLKHRV